jgi:hypothetical protein
VAGLRSYFVTQARQSGLTDAEIAMLIGDKNGPQLIAQVYGDVRPDHLLKQAKRIQLRATGRATEGEVCIPTLPLHAARFDGSTVDSEAA